MTQPDDLAELIERIKTARDYAIRKQQQQVQPVRAGDRARAEAELETAIQQRVYKAIEDTMNALLDGHPQER